MITNFEIIKDFRDVRSIAEAFTKSNMCCDKSEYNLCQAIVSDSHFSDKEQEKNCFRCWLDFLTSDSGLHSNLDLENDIVVQKGVVKLSEKSMEILSKKQGVTK